MRLPEARVAEIRSRLSLPPLRRRARRRAHERPRPPQPARGGGRHAVALLFGLPLAWLLFRTDLPGRHVRARPVHRSRRPAAAPHRDGRGPRRHERAARRCSDFEGERSRWRPPCSCSAASSSRSSCSSSGRALAAVPAGAVEAARLLGGRRAAFVRVVLPGGAPGRARRRGARVRARLVRLHGARRAGFHASGRRRRPSTSSRPRSSSSGSSTPRRAPSRRAFPSCS